MEFKDKLSALMSEKKLTKMELSRRARVSRPTIDRYLKGGEPNRRVLRDLAEGLDVPVEELIIPPKKTARELFEELGYTLHEDYNYGELVFKKGVEPEAHIVFDLDKKTLSVYDWSDYMSDFEPHSTTLQELEAINKMIEELGWSDE